MINPFETNRTIHPKASFTMIDGLGLTSHFEDTM